MDANVRLSFATSMDTSARGWTGWRSCWEGLSSRSASAAAVAAAPVASASGCGGSLSGSRMMKVVPWPIWVSEADGAAVLGDDLDGRC